MISRVLGKPKIELILGPPGCGKTHTLRQRIQAELDAGVPKHRIACLTFTRAASDEMRQRLADQGEMMWMRTIHSAAYKLLDLKRVQVFGDEAWKEFGDKYGYEFTAGSDSDPSESRWVTPKTKADKFRYVRHWGRTQGLTAEAAAGKCQVRNLDLTAFLQFDERADAFRRIRGLVEFPDFLTEVLKRRLVMDIDALVVDEAQDLSPTQVEVVKLWMTNAQRVVFVGDDDQAIYGFQGADPRWLTEFAREVPTQVLSQSHRVPIAVHALAEAIITQNRNRVAKEYRPTEHFGQTLRLSLKRAVELVDGSRSTFVLVRNRVFLGAVVKLLREQGVPYLIEGGGASNPFGRHDFVLALREAVALGADDGSSDSVPEVATLLRILKATAGDEASVVAALRDAVRLGGPASVFPKLTPENRTYFERVIARFGGIPEPNVLLTTIHGAKGREADHVLVLPNMTSATFETYQSGGDAGREAENRCFYVAVTRTRHTLVLVDHETKKHYHWPSEKSEEGRL